MVKSSGRPIVVYQISGYLHKFLRGYWRMQWAGCPKSKHFPSKLPEYYGVVMLIFPLEKLDLKCYGVKISSDICSRRNVC